MFGVCKRDPSWETSHTYLHGLGFGKGGSGFCCLMSSGPSRVCERQWSFCGKYS